jgi:hypothetical protein
MSSSMATYALLVMQLITQWLERNIQTEEDDVGMTCFFSHFLQYCAVL